MLPAILLLEFQHQHSAGLPPLLQVLFQHRKRLPVSQEAGAGKLLIGILLDVLEVERRVMVHHHHMVAGEVHVKLTAPESIVLGGLEGG